MKSALIHITFLMVHLADPEKLKLAKEVLQSLQTDIQTDILNGSEASDPQPLALTLKGLRADF